MTGASGFIAKHLIPRLRSAGHDVFEIDRRDGDIAHEKTWAGLPRAEVVIHLAGKSFVPDSWVDPSSFFSCNMLGTAAALEYCKKNAARMIFLSSYMYGNPERLPIPENAPLIANNPYALSKKFAEELSRFYTARFAVDVSVLRLFNVYGPGQGDKFLIPSVIRQVCSGTRVHVRDLEPKRDYVHVTDVSQAIIRALSTRRGFHVYNIGSGVSYSVSEIIQTVQDVWGTDLLVSSDSARRLDEIMDTIADISEAKRWLGWEPQFGLLAGIRDIFEKQGVAHVR